MQEISVKNVKKLAKALRRYSKGKVDNPFCGICGNLESQDLTPRRATMPHELMARLPMFWKHFSGDTSFPIPGGAEKYYKCQGKDALWEGKQLKYRKSLSKFLARALERMIKEAQETGKTTVVFLE